MPSFKFRWLVFCLLAPLLAVILWIAVFGWNWARGPIQSLALEKTGRELVIGGDLSVHWGWPSPHIRAASVTFANPRWAKEKQMLKADQVDITLNLTELLHQRLAVPQVHLVRPIVFLERTAEGRKTWLLDRDQKDESAHIPIERLTLDDGRLGYDDALQKTSILINVSTPTAAENNETASAAPGVRFDATGVYKTLPLTAQGNAGSVLALHDESSPYPLNLDAKIGSTRIKAEGRITSLLKFSAVDLQLSLQGDSLASLFPLLGIALPATPPYATTGHMLHSLNLWRYEKFSGRIGKSDIGGSLQVSTGTARPMLRGALVSASLDLNDLGPVVGVKAAQVSKVSRPAAEADSRALPDIPFNTERWHSVDADVTLHAKTITNAASLPLENLEAHLSLRDALLTLDPLDFGVGGGHLKAVIAMNGRQNPIQGRARISVQKILLSKLFPKFVLGKTSLGQINGAIDLDGKGNSVGSLLATADGKAGLVVESGEISELLTQQISLHLLEILHLKIVGDKDIKLNCAVTDLSVKQGQMQVNTLVVDTEATTITGSGSVDLAHETLNLKLVPQTKATSLVALRGPVYVRGTFTQPQIGVDVGLIAARGIGAIALGLVNPLLALAPLVEMGPGMENKCPRLIHAANSGMTLKPQKPGQRIKTSPP